MLMIQHLPVFSVPSTIDGIEINRVTDFNFLCLMINENLNWKMYIEKVANSISKTISILNRLKHYVPLNIKTRTQNSELRN